MSDVLRRTVSDMAQALVRHVHQSSEQTQAWRRVERVHALVSRGDSIARSPRVAVGKPDLPRSRTPVREKSCAFQSGFHRVQVWSVSLTLT